MPEIKALRIHPLVATFVKRQINNAGEIQAVLEKVLLEKAVAHNLSGETVQLLAWQPHLRRIADSAIPRADEQAAELCAALGDHLLAIGDYAGAQRYHEQALTIREMVLGRHPTVAQSLERLGHLHQSQGNYDEAMAYFERTLAILEETSGEKHLAIVQSLTNLGTLLRTQGKPNQARAYFEQALAIQEQILGANHPDVVVTLNNLGALLHSVGDLTVARHYFERVVAIQEQVMGPDHPSLARGLNNLGTILMASGDYVGARPYLERTLALRGQTLGTSHPDVATAFSNLGNLYTDLGDYATAQTHYEEALSIVRMVLGETHPDTAAILHSLGELLQKQGDYSGALARYEEVLQIARKNSSRRMEGEVLRNLGAIYGATKAKERALQCYEQALHIANNLGQPLEVAEVLTALGTLARDDGQFEQAKEYWTQSKDIYRELEHPLETSVVFLLKELETTHAELFSLVDTTQSFFRAAGFELVRDEDNIFRCRPKARTWQSQFAGRSICIKVVTGTPLDAQKVRSLYNLVAREKINQPVVFVVVDQTPTDDGWLQIGTARLEDVRIIPIDDATILAGQERGKQKQVLNKHLRRFFGEERDLYNVRDPVADRLNFFGREVLANELVEQLIEGRPMALIGLRKMGKSSLLNFLRDKLPFPTALVDLQASLDIADLYERVLSSWERSLHVKVKEFHWSAPSPTNVANPSSVFVRSVRHLLKFLEDNEVTPRLCLLVDEADLMMPQNSKELDRYLTFARSLRGLVQEEQSRFSLLITGVDPALNRTIRLWGRQNPFYQFFREVYLPPLNREDCIQMIRNIGRQMGLIYSEEALNFVADISGGHPFLARQLCSLVFQQFSRTGEKVALFHLQEGATRFVREPGKAELLDEHGLWGEISDPYLWPPPQIAENERVLTTLAQVEPQPESELLNLAQDLRACERSLDELEKRAVLGQPEAHAYDIQLRLFRHWIRRYKLGME